MITLSTYFTFARIVLVPFIIIAMFGQQWGVACVLFMIAASTDLIDGFLARYFHQQTLLGACLDPIADKLLILAVYFTLAFVHTPLFVIPSWFVFLVLCKELLLIIGFLVLFYSSGFTLSIQPTFLGKITMLAQVFFVIWLFACYFFNWLPIKTYYTVLSILSILVVGTFIQYMVAGGKLMIQKRTDA